MASRPAFTFKSKQASTIPLPRLGLRDEESNDEESNDEESNDEEVSDEESSDEESNHKQVKKTSQATIVWERDTVGKRDDLPVASTIEYRISPFKPLAMNFSDGLLWDEVLKIQKVDHKFHICRGLTAQGAQCTNRVSASHAFSIKLLQMSLASTGNMTASQGKSLAAYSLCEDHTEQSTKLNREWKRLTRLTSAARDYWLNQRKYLTAGPQAPLRVYSVFSAAEVRRILAQDEIRAREEKEKSDLYVESQKTVESLRRQLNNNVSAMENRIESLTTENKSLKEAQESTEIDVKQERERHRCELSDANTLHGASLEIAETLRKEIDSLKSHIGKLETKVVSLKDSLETAQAALTKEELHSRELEIRLEERIALGTKTQDSPETKLEKYIREELDKSQRHALQQQKEFEKLRDGHVRLQITNATLESQVNQMEAVKEELSRASRRETQELAEKNSDLSSQLHNTRAQFEQLEELSRASGRETKELAEKNSDLSSQLHNTRAQFEQLKEGLAAMEKENKGEASKSKFSLREFYRRPKNEPSRPQMTPADESN
jgi:hypothetical protein